VGILRKPVRGGWLVVFRRVALVLLVLVLSPLMFAVPPTSASVTCDGTFHREASPTYAGRASLVEVSQPTATQGWTVGSVTIGSGEPRSLALRWNGSSWTEIPLDVPANFGPYDVVSFPNDRAYSVGRRALDNGGDAGGMIERWNGSAWSQVVSLPPVVHATNALVTSVGGVSASDVWALGQYYSSAKGYRTFALHWTGMQWSRVPMPVPVDTFDGPIGLGDIAAVATDDVWAVGAFPTDPGGEVLFGSLGWRAVDDREHAESACRFAG
jgi:photosystem II stability/assembly factor-like uncharacterized protein